MTLEATSQKGINYRLDPLVLETSIYEFLFSFGSEVNRIEVWSKPKLECIRNEQRIPCSQVNIRGSEVDFVSRASDAASTVRGRRLCELENK